MFKFLVKITFFIILFINASYSEIVNSIDITGNKRLSNESIILFGKIELNKDYSNEDLNNVLKDLYSTDFFNK